MSDIDAYIDEVERRIDLLFDDETMLQINQVFAEMCDPYVPYLTGDLSRNVVVTPKDITYTSEYAEKQYYGTEFNHNLETHPLATALWDKVMLSDVGDDFCERVKEILVRRANELFG